MTKQKLINKILFLIPDKNEVAIKGKWINSRAQALKYINELLDEK